ncbi:phage terminase small subunit [Yersinia bercovieri]|uniref:phage terminase small subunit n=1 Tax=Yersinia bercovieri TaxID=634 RepID=UPI0021BD9B93|nr:phage terminase small subunit [Yersinia bercovieri]
MLTPAQRHYDKVMAERRGTTEDVVQGSAYEQQLYRLRIDQRRLSQFQSHLTRATMKREMLPAYDGWLDGVLAANSGQSDEVVTTCMVWSVDAGLYRDALRLAEYVIGHTPTAWIPSPCPPCCGYTAINRISFSIPTGAKPASPLRRIFSIAPPPISCCTLS